MAIVHLKGSETNPKLDRIDWHEICAYDFFCHAILFMYVIDVTKHHHPTDEMHEENIALKYDGILKHI